jgi:glycosyltransferase involved in cell wall biosynthesis
LRRKIRILYIIDKLVCAGTQKQLIELLKGIDRSRYEPAVCCLLFEGQWANKVRELGIPIHVLGLKKIYGLKALHRFLRLIRLIKRGRYDIVHNFLFAANVFGTLAAKFARTRVVMNSRRQAGYWNENPNRLVWRFVNKYSDCVIANSENVKSFIASNEGIDADKILVIHNGMEITSGLPEPGRIRRELSLPVDSIVICIVANLSTVKGHSYLVRAFEKVHAVCQAAHLVCVGDGPLRKNLEREVRDRGLSEAIHFLGRREDVLDILADADVGVMSSLSEGMPNAILEYMLTGIPVAASAVGGITDIIRHDENGLLVSPGDVEALSETLMRLCESSELREQLGTEGRKDVELRFNSKRMVEEYQRVYSSLIRTRTRAQCRKSLKVAYIISQFPSYDETFVTRELKALVDLGVDLTIFPLKPCRDRVIHEDARALLVRTRYLPFVSFRNLMNMLYLTTRYPIRVIRSICQVLAPSIIQPLNLLKLMYVFPKMLSCARYITEEGYSHIHAHWATIPTDCAMILARLTGVSFSFTGHAHDIFLKNSTLGRKLNEAEFVLTCNGENKKHLVRTFPDVDESKIIISYHGIDLQEYLPKKLNNARKGRVPFEILGVGSLFECKGFEYLIRACSELSHSGIDYRCKIIGGGHLHGKLDALIRQLNLQDRVELLGYMSQGEIVRYYQDADIFVLPALLKIHWGIPNVLLESLAVGTPIVCTPLPALKELMNGRTCGYTIPEKNPAAIAEVIEMCARDGNELLAFGAEGRRRIEERFDLRKNARHIRDILHETVA